MPIGIVWRTLTSTAQRYNLVYPVLLERTLNSATTPFHMLRQVPIEILVLTDGVEDHEVFAFADLVSHEPLIVLGLELLHPRPPKGWLFALPLMWILK